jgi:hypothetical protein
MRLPWTCTAVLPAKAYVRSSADRSGLFGLRIHNDSTAQQRAFFIEQKRALNI